MTQNRPRYDPAVVTVLKIRLPRRSDRATVGATCSLQVALSINLRDRAGTRRGGLPNLLRGPPENPHDRNPLVQAG